MKSRRERKDKIKEEEQIRVGLGRNKRREEDFYKKYPGAFIDRLLRPEMLHMIYLWNINYDGKRQPRILFLADRNILANQAFNAFSLFQENSLVRIRPEAPIREPLIIRAILPKINPVKAATIPEYEFNNAITTGISAPPIGNTIKIPSIRQEQIKM